MGSRGMVRGSKPFQARAERGAVLIEAALITPLFVMLLFGIWTTARAWNIHNVLDHAAREAARYGGADPTHNEIQLVAQGEVIAGSIPWADVTYCASVVQGGSGTLNDGTSGTCLNSGTNPGDDPTTDDRVQVSLLIPDYPLNFVFFNTTVDLQARAVARLEPGA